MSWEESFNIGFYVTYLALAIAVIVDMEWDKTVRDLLLNTFTVFCAVSGIFLLSACLVKFVHWLFGGAG